MFKRNLVFLFISTSFLISCGGGSSSSPSSTEKPVTLPVIYPSHPYVWDEATPESVGMSSAKLSQAFDYAMQDGSFTQAALIIKDGKLIHERYRGITDSEANLLVASVGRDQNFFLNLFSSRDRDSLATSWSTSKSFVSFLIGIAVSNGTISSINDSASIYINEWSTDDRSSITIKNILDMRSGLVPICFDFLNNELAECSSGAAVSSGGNIVYSDDQLSKCINRSLAEDGVTHPWYSDGGTIYHRGDFKYSNCDTMVLGEIIFRASGQDIQTYAEYNLFSKIGISATWWKDFVSQGQSNGNLLAYCCLDSTSRDFAKFGHMLLLGGIWEGSIQSHNSYVEAIRGLESYGLQFWTICARYTTNLNCDESIISTIGLDGQYIMIDFNRNIVVVRNSLYQPIFNASQEMKMKLFPGDLSQSNWLATPPSGLGANINTNFNPTEFYSLILDAIN